MTDSNLIAQAHNTRSVQKLLTWSLILVFGLLVWHLIVMPFFDFGADEAHYALYALNLDYGYFDHPPVVGWMLSPLMLVKSDVLSRLTSLLWMAVIYCIIYIHTYRLFGSHIISKLTLVIFSINPMVQILWFGLVPDTPLIISLFMLLLILPPQKNIDSLSWKQASLLGVGTGLAGLSKFTAIIIPISWLLEGRLNHWWYKPQFYWAICVAVLVVSPFVFFLWQTDFATLNYQFNHAVSGNIKLSNILLWLVIQLLAYGPLLVLFIIPVLIAYWKTMGWIKFYIIALFSVSLYSASKGNILPHWTISLYAVATPYIAYFIYSALHNGSKKIWLKIAATFNVVLVFILAFFITLISIKPDAAPSWLRQELAGWQEIAIWSKQLKHDYKADTILLDNWSHVSRIAWYVYPESVLSLDQKNQQFIWWYGSIKSHDTGILVLLDGQSMPDALKCSYIENLGSSLRQARAFFCRL